MAELSTATRNELPDSAFACPDSRKYPHHKADGSLDLPHLRNALARIADPGNEQCGKAHLMGHAKSAGIGEAKAVLPVKAQPLDLDELKAWFEGKIPRRILSIPFGGPIPAKAAPRGTDLDGEWFSERTDIYGPYSELRATRERPADFHHSAVPPGQGYGDPTGMMIGSFIGKSILDPDPDEDGWWSDFWFKAGEKRVRLIEQLAAKGAQLFGSSQPIGPVKKNPATGEIEVWPHFIQTISPSPQNTLSVHRAKAMLDYVDAETSGPMRELVTELDALSANLDPTSERGEGAAKAGRVLSAASIAAIERALGELAELVTAARKRYEPEDE